MSIYIFDLLLLFSFISVLRSEIIKVPKYNKPFEIVTHKVYMDISVNSASLKRIHIALFGKTMPNLAYNFRQLCLGVKVKNRVLHYKGTRFNKIQRYSWMEGGDFLNVSNRYGISYNESVIMPDNYNLGHNGMGYVGMRPDNGTKFSSFFYFTSRKLLKFDDNCVVIGKILYEEERLWIRNLTRYYGDEHGAEEFYGGVKLVNLPNITIVDSGELPLNGDENWELNPDLHRKVDL